MSVSFVGAALSQESIEGLGKTMENLSGTAQIQYVGLSFFVFLFN
jgi:hypothetical protein